MISLFFFKKESFYVENVEDLRNRFSEEILFNNDFSKTSNLSSFKKIEGFFTDKKFTFRRTLSFGYSAFPVICYGVIERKEIENTVQVHIKYRFHRITELIIFVLLSIFIFMFLNSFYFYVFGREKSLNLSKISNISSNFFWLFIIYSSIVLIFNYELNLIRNKFLNMLGNGLD